METVPDAPWIREAEMYGIPSDDPVHCPVCGEECETIYEDKFGTVFGCDECVCTRDAYDWAEEQREAERPDN